MPRVLSDGGALLESIGDVIGESVEAWEITETPLDHVGMLFRESPESLVVTRDGRTFVINIREVKGEWP